MAKKSTKKKKKPVRKKKAAPKKAMARSSRSVGERSEIILQKGNFVLEKISNTKWCCMKIEDDGRRKQHVCFKTEKAARFHMEGTHNN